MATTALQIANKIIQNTDTERGDIVSNLKLQKLLYYLQGFHLAVFDKELFSEDFEAWQYGPVVPEVYHNFKEFGSWALEMKEENGIPELTEEQEDLFFQVMTEYGQFNAVKLMEMTHEEEPWKNAFVVPGSTIDKEALKSFFKTRIDDEN